MTNKIRGGAFRLTGLILGIVGATVSLTAIVFSTIGLHQAHLCKTCKKGEEFIKLRLDKIGGPKKKTGNSKHPYPLI